MSRKAARQAGWLLLYVAATAGGAALAAGVARLCGTERAAAVGLLSAAVGLPAGTVVLGLRRRYGSPAAAPGLFALGAAVRFVAAPGGVLLIRSAVPSAPPEAVAAILVVTLLAGLAVEFAALRSPAEPSATPPASADPAPAD